MRLRQVVVAARDLESTVETIGDVLGIEVAFRDPDVSAFGLENAVFPVGDTFLEVVSPVTGDAPARRFLDRRGGDAGYMVMFETDRLAEDRVRFEKLGIRTVWSIDLDDIAANHLHPRDLGGPIVSVDQPRPAGAWRWAGPDWKARARTDRVGRVTAATLVSRDPRGLARRWGSVLGVDPVEAAGAWQIPLEGSSIDVFTGEPEGALVRFDFEARDARAVLDRAHERGLPVTESTVEIAGVDMRLVT